MNTPIRTTTVNIGKLLVFVVVAPAGHVGSTRVAHENEDPAMAATCFGIGRGRLAIVIIIVGSITKEASANHHFRTSSRGGVRSTRIKDKILTSKEATILQSWGGVSKEDVSEILASGLG